MWLPPSPPNARDAASRTGTAATGVATDAATGADIPVDSPVDTEAARGGWSAAGARAASPAWLRVGLFLAIYALLQWAYQSLRDSRFDPWFIHTLTVSPAATLIGWLAPADAVVAVGPRLVWPGGRLTLQAGCDGFEVMALFAAAMLVADLPWRRGLAGLVLGCTAVWALNQARIAVLYLSFRYERRWFDPVHTTYGPLVLMAAVAVIYALVLGWRPAALGRGRAQGQDQAQDQAQDLGGAACR